MSTKSTPMQHSALPLESGFFSVGFGTSGGFFLFQDDKSRVPLGITAANAQSPMLMHLEYRVTLPDHDWVVAERHKLMLQYMPESTLPPMVREIHDALPTLVPPIFRLGVENIVVLLRKRMRKI